MLNRVKDFLKKSVKQRDGYLSIEASMVFSVLFFALIFILFIGMVLYQEVTLQSLAIRASERGSVIYSARVSDMSTGIKTLDDFKNRDPYRNVPFMNMSSDGKYVGLVEGYAKKYLNENSILSGNVNTPQVKMINRIVSKRVSVHIDAGYQLPVASIGEMFGQKGPFDVSTTCVSAVVDSPDFVRTVDLALDVVKKTEFFESAQKGYSKIMEAVDSVKDKLQ